MQESTKGMLDIILDSNRMLVDGIKKQFSLNAFLQKYQKENSVNYNIVVDSIFSINDNNRHAEYICKLLNKKLHTIHNLHEEHEEIECRDYYNSNNDDIHYELINALRKKCGD